MPWPNDSKMTVNGKLDQIRRDMRPNPTVNTPRFMEMVLHFHTSWRLCHPSRWKMDNIIYDSSEDNTSSWNLTCIHIRNGSNEIYLNYPSHLCSSQLRVTLFACWWMKHSHSIWYKDFGEEMIRKCQENTILAIWLLRKTLGKKSLFYPFSFSNTFTTPLFPISFLTLVFLPFLIKILQPNKG